MISNYFKCTLNVLEEKGIQMAVQCPEVKFHMCQGQLSVIFSF